MLFMIFRNLKLVKVNFNLINSNILFGAKAPVVSALSLAPTLVSEPVEDKVGAIKAP